jgi:hypothetical protein
LTSAAALLAATLAALRADTELTATLGPRIWDCAPRDAAFPHLVVKDLVTRDRSGEAAPLEEIRLSLRILSRSGSRAEVLTLAARAEAVMLALPPALDPANSGARLVLLRRDTAETRLLDDRRTTEALLRFVALVEREG